MNSTLRATLIAAAVAALPLNVSAAGFGKLNVFSALGQPLRAEVEVSGSPDELESLSARVASQEAFRRANVEYSPNLSTLRLAVERRGSGAVVKLTSDRPFNEPFVDVLLELSWSGGRLVREYTFLLDPVDESGRAPVAGTAVMPAVTATDLKPAERPPVRRTTPRGEPRPATAAPARSKSPAPVAEGEYRVRSGDTLTGIAARTRSSGVTLEQMLAALYVGNADSFPNGDINRLAVGQVLNVPSAAQASSLSTAEARSILSAPATNFAAYRQKLAAAAGATPSRSESAQQSVSGKVTPKVDEPAAAQAPKDQLRIAKTQVEKSGAGTDGKAAARMQALEEDIAARDKALKDATERVALLEKNVKDLQKLVELKNQSLAELQKQASKPGKDAAAAKEAPAEVSAPVAAKPEVPAEASVPQPAASPVVEPAAPVAAASPTVEAAPEPAPVPVVSAPAPVVSAPAPAPAEPPAAAEEESFVDSVLGNPLSVGGLLALLGLGGFLAWRGRQKGARRSPDTTALNATQTGTESVIGPAGGQTVDTGSSVLPTDFSQSGLTSIDADEGVDPVAEADVYMAYGRDAQAEEILLDALKSDPSRTAIHAKLLEIYAQRKSLKPFENIATDLYTQTGGVGGDWAKAAELGAKLDPENPLYRSAARTAEVTAEPAMLDELSFVETVAEPPSDLPGEPEPLEFGGVAPTAVPPVAQPEPLPSGPGFVTASPSQMQATWTMPGEIGQIARAVEAGEQNEPPPPVEDMGLDFNLDLDVEPLPTPPASAPQSPEISALDFPMPEPAPDLEEDALSAQEARLTTTDVRGTLPAADDAPLTLDLDGFGAADDVPAVRKDDDLGVESVAGTAEAVVDLEKTNFEGGLLDFDFDVEPPPAATMAQRTVDLSGIDLELPSEPVPAQTEADVTTHPEPQLLDEELDVGEEVTTKLELARAYEEMRDFEGARELLEEVIQDGSAAQKREAESILARLA